MARADLAREYFKSGLNCAQAVVLAYEDVMGLDRDQLLKLAAPFGGGVGRMREICGTVSGMMIVLGAVFYNPAAPANAAKTALYAREQEVAARFRKENGSIVCRELLAGVGADSGPIASERTSQYYKKRPCAELCACAAQILETYLEEEGILPFEGGNRA